MAEPADLKGRANRISEAEDGYQRTGHDAGAAERRFKLCGAQADLQQRQETLPAQRPDDGSVGDEIAKFGTEMDLRKDMQHPDAGHRRAFGPRERRATRGIEGDSKTPDELSEQYEEIQSLPNDSIIPTRSSFACALTLCLRTIKFVLCFNSP